MFRKRVAWQVYFSGRDLGKKKKKKRILFLSDSERFLKDLWQPDEKQAAAADNWKHTHGRPAV